MNTSRREFLAASAAFAALGGCRTTDCGSVCRAAKKGGRWYKGNLHAHTFWSDGEAFPEEAVAWYKSRGYNFLGLSDHNVFQDDPDRWVDIIGDDVPWKKPENTGGISYRSTLRGPIHTRTQDLAIAAHSRRRVTTAGSAMGRLNPPIAHCHSVPSPEKVFQVVWVVESA